MTARLIVIGLDAAEATLIETWTRQGLLPNLARLMRHGTTFRLGNSLETLPGAIWPELQTGISCGRVPHFYHPRQLRTGEARVRPLDASDVDAETYFWTRAARAGLKVAAIDMPQTVAARAFEHGLQIFEWGLHDRNFEITSEPPSVLDEIRARWGDHPVDMCDKHGCTEAGYDELLAGLTTGIGRKTELLVEYLDRQSWDLFACCFGETHCVGHQFWHFQDRSHPRFDPDAPERFKNAVKTIYELADAGVGKLIEHAGPDAHVIVVASHGMGLYTGGPHLLPEFLAKMGLSTGKAKAPAASGLRALQRSRGPLAMAVKAIVKPILGKSGIRTLQSSIGGLHEPFTTSETRAGTLQNNRCGAIRLNVKGREPNGSVAAGNEAAALMEDIRTALFELRHPETDERIVERVMTAREAFGPDHHPDVPDIIVVFRTDLGILDAARSPTLGLIETPLFTPLLPRSGDHTPESRLWIAGPGILEGAFREEGNVLDLAPTVLDLLGLPQPETIDGQVLPVRTALA